MIGSTERDVIQSTASDMLTAKGKIASLPLNDDLDSQLQAPILDAVCRIVTILDEVSKTAEKYAVRSEPTTAEQQKAYSPEATIPKSIAQGLSTALSILGVRGTALTSVMTDHRQSASTLQKRNSFRVKFTFGSKPWGQPDKKLLEDKVKELAYWNDRLKGLLPQTLRTTIENQAIPGH
jgi:Prion-inhibition and propagation